MFRKMKVPATILGGMMLALGIQHLTLTVAMAQGTGPFAPHAGLKITRAYTSQYGPDAEEYNVITGVSAEGIKLSYSDTRGITANRVVRAIDAQTAKTYLIGFDPRVPLVVPGTTSLGLSSTALQQLRTAGSTSINLMYDTKLSTIPGVLTLVNDNAKLPVLVENQIVNMPVLAARGVFQKGNRTGTGYFFFLSDVKNPVAIQYNVRFSWEKALRTIRTVRVSAGRSQQAAMEQTLKTIRKLDLYGIHFDFDKATIRPASRKMMGDIATTLKNNPKWTLDIRGHTDAIGKPDYNLQLSARRAASVKNALVSRHGVSPNRLRTSGAGMSEPKATNKTLQGRAQNRRVELTRTDR
jgi:outer membrane protein OmpA-like peptidoglycan-associated protein